MNSKRTNQLLLAALLSAFAVVGSGCGSSGGSSDLTDATVAQRDTILAIQKVQNDIAEKKKVSKWEVSAKELQADPKIKEMKLDDENGLQRIQGAIGMDVDDMPPLKDFSGYKLVDMKNPDERLKKYSTNKQPPANSPQTPASGYEPLLDRLKTAKFVVMDLKVTQTMPPAPTEAGKPAPPPETKTIELSLGPIDEKEADTLIDQAKKAGTKVEKSKTYPVKLYIGPKGKLAFGIDASIDASKLQPARGLTYYMLDVDTMKKLDEARKKDATLPFMQAKNIDVAIVGYKKKEK